MIQGSVCQSSNLVNAYLVLVKTPFEKKNYELIGMRYDIKLLSVVSEKQA